MSLSKSNKGALAEYRTACLFLLQGWTPFLSMVPNSPSDLIIRRRARNFTVQVKSGANAANPRNLRQNHGSNDILAVVSSENIILKVRNRQIQRLFPGSILARPPKPHRNQPQK